MWKTSPKGLQTVTDVRYVHWQFCDNLGISRARFWYQHEPQSVVENKNFKILWDFTIQYDPLIEDTRPDIVVVDK